MKDCLFMTSVRPTESSNEILFIRKPAATTHFENNYTLAERKLINICIGHAQEEGIASKEYDMAVRDLEYWKVIPETRNRKWLEEVVTGVVTKAITWNSLGKDRVEEWGVCTFLASGRIRGGRFKYRLNPELVARLSNPKVWGRFRLLAQLNITHRHALVLYEYLGTELSIAGRDVNEIAAILSVDDFRSLCGLKDGQYPEFKALNRFVIKPAVAEICKQTDLEVEYKTKRVQRKVSELIFKVSRKENFQFALPQLSLPRRGDDDDDFAENGDEERAELFAALVDAGIQETAAGRIVESFEPDRIKRNLAYAMEQTQKGHVTRLAAYTVKAIQEDYRPAPTREELEKDQATKRAVEQNRLEETEAAREKELRAEFDKFREKRVREIFESKPAKWQKARRKKFADELLARPASDIWRQCFEDKGWAHGFVNGSFFGELQEEVLSAPEETDFDVFRNKHSAKVVST